jgi:iron complex transport system ATP-binding protein
LEAVDLKLAYDRQVVAEDLNLAIPDGKITAVVGPNACGKSTLLRAMARLLRPRRGAVVLDGKDIHQYPTREVARRLGLLPQSPLAPAGIKVVDLVSRGRTPYQSLFRQWSHGDETAVLEAMSATGTTHLADRLVDELSGGQRQRVWVAMVLAQQTEWLLLDEPTTFLDIAHQIEVLEMVSELNRDGRRTIVIVLHDLNLACRYAHHLVAIREGEVISAGSPATVITSDLVSAVFGIDAVVVSDPVRGTPLVIPGRLPAG